MSRDPVSDWLALATLVLFMCTVFYGAVIITAMLTAIL